MTTLWTGPNRDPARAEGSAGVILFALRGGCAGAVVVGLAFAPSLRYLDDHAPDEAPPVEKNTQSFPIFDGILRLA